MKICFPVQNDKGMDSEVYNHFGSAPLFMIVDTETNSVQTLSNKDRIHEHGACNPLKALDGHVVDAVIVGGIGPGALSRLNEKGIRVYRADAAGLEENIGKLKAGRLAEFTLSNACGGHGKGGHCSH